MTLGIRALNVMLQMGSVIGGIPTPEPMRQVARSLIGADGACREDCWRGTATIHAESAGPTEWSKFRGSEALSERFDQIR